MFKRVHSLAAAAPTEVSSDWKTLDTAVTTMENALKEAGIKPSDLAAMQKGQLPQGADLQKLQALGTKLQSLSSSDVTSAAQAIAKNAKDRCGVDLNASYSHRRRSSSSRPRLLHLPRPSASPGGSRAQRPPVKSAKTPVNPADQSSSGATTTINAKGDAPTNGRARTVCM